LKDNYEIICGVLPEGILRKVHDFWIENRILTEPETTTRLQNLIAVRLREEKVVSVATVKVNQFGPYGVYYFFSTSTAISERNRFIPTQENLLRITIQYLRDLPVRPKPKGVIAVLENKRISPKAASKLGGMSYLGTAPNGNHVMYVNFDGSLLTHDATSKHN
jgi:hypothetical protein